MKNLLTIFLIFFLSETLLADIGVKSFRKLENDLDARVNEPLKDQNGDICAIIKVVTTQTGFSFDCGQIGVVKTVPKTSEIWVYVPFGAKRITISHPQLGLLRDYLFQQAIEKATVYELVLTTGKVITTVDETIESQWLVINPEPADASIYINDLFVKSGAYQAKHKPGNYSYRIEAPMYHSDAGMVQISDVKKEIDVKLKPAFGYIEVTSIPEADARVAVDGKFLPQKTPCQSDALPSGEHTIQVIKEMFEPTTQKITVSDGKTTPVSITLIPTFAEVTITSQTDATIFINNEKKENGSWKGRLNAGIYSIEARKQSHSPAKQDIEVAAGEKRTIDLQPSPIYGSLNVITKPSGAAITINGNKYKVTPNTIDSLLIGDQTVELSRQNFITVNKIVTIVEGKVTMLNEQLVRGKSPEVKQIPNDQVTAPVQNTKPQNNSETNNPPTIPNTERNRILQNSDNENTTTQTSNSLRNRVLQNTPADNKTTKQPTTPTKTEPIKTEPIKTEPIKTEPAKTEPAKPELPKEVAVQVQKVFLNSTPSGAEIYVDSVKVGITPFSITLTIGNHLVRLQQGIQKIVRNITVVKSRTENVYNFDLAPRPFTESVNGMEFTMVAVKGGTFRMGSNEGRSVEKPVHSVDIDDFYLCSTEVTQAFFKSVMEYNVSNNKGDDLPVERVSWNEAMEFIQKLNILTGKNYRLPTEAEWEYAASIDVSGFKNSWSGINIEKKLGDYGWYAANSEGKTHPVKQKLANERGLYDMTGNVWEWCSDWYGEYKSNPRGNPTGPTSGTTRVNRGGGWDDDGPYSRASNRDENNPEEHFSNVGFRIALSTK
ncbi:MAG: SUMF1/EgtB/PvdO family nonheme iron enzyme [Mariniphaga sp.]